MQHQHKHPLKKKGKCKPPAWKSAIQGKHKSLQLEKMPVQNADGG
jgi:hypothetical protein